MDAPETPAIPSNAELARVFHEIGDMLEVKGELVYKTVAYQKAADAIAHSPVEVSRAYLEGRPPRISGVGDAIARKIEELARTGRLAFYDRLREEVPPSLVALLAIPGWGPAPSGSCTRISASSRSKICAARPRPGPCAG